MWRMPKKKTNEELDEYFNGDIELKRLYRDWEAERNMQLRFYSSKGFYKFLTKEQQDEAKAKMYDALADEKYEKMFKYIAEKEKIGDK